jgi:hypothetical protein
MNPEHNFHLDTLFKRYRQEAEQLLSRQKDSQQKTKEALLISEKILKLNNQVLAETYKLAGVEKDISASSVIMEFICSDLVRALSTNVYSRLKGM